MFLAIERWCAVLRPIQYRCNFHHNWVYVYIVSAVFFTTLSSAIATVIILGNDNNIIEYNGFIFCVDFFLTFVIPFLVTWITFFNLWLRSRRPPHQKTYNSRAKQKLVHMCAITALLFTLCWLPAEIYFFIYMMGFISKDYSISKPVDSIAMSNSIVNPWIYYITNLEYRKEINALVKGVLSPMYSLLNCSNANSYGVGNTEKQKVKRMDFFEQLAPNHSLPKRNEVRGKR